MKNFSASDRNESQTSRHTKDYKKRSRVKSRGGSASTGDRSRDNNRSR